MSTESNAAGWLLTARFTASTSGALASISFFALDPTGNGNAALYGDNSGKPGTLLAQGTPQQLVSGVNTFSSLSASVTITASTSYWLAFEMSSGSYYVGGSGTRGWASATCCTMPNAVTLKGTAAGSNAIYATYSSGPPPPPPALSFNVKSTATQIIVTLTYSWTGASPPPQASISIAGPSGVPTLLESGAGVYDRTTIAVSGGSNTFSLIHRVTFQITAPGTQQVWTVLVSLAGVSSYNLAIEVT